MKNIYSFLLFSLSLSSLLSQSQIISDQSDQEFILNNSEATCNWTVNVQDLRDGDVVSWELRNSGGEVILSGGPYLDGPYSDTQSISTEGPLEFYIETIGSLIFNAPYFTISNENGDILKKFIHAGKEVTYSNLNCTDMPRESYVCDDYDVLSNEFETGGVFGGDSGQKLAIDIPIEENGFTLYGIVPTVSGTASSFNFIIYEDAGGVPGSIIMTRSGIIVNELFVGTNSSGSDFMKYTVKFDTPINFEQNTVYWIEILSDAYAWEATTAIDSGIGHKDVYKSSNGPWFTGNSEYVFEVVCDELSVEDNNNKDFSYYPNPTSNILNFKSDKEIKSISVHNLAGQKVLMNDKISNNQMNLSSLPTGTYVFRVELENGQIETFKIVKK